jgi:hypothetical protein
LLVPYILLSLLFLALDPVLYNFDLFPKAPRMTVMNIKPEIATVWDYIYWNLAKIFVAGKSSIGSGPLWFVFTLYSVSLMFYGVQWVAIHFFSQTRKEMPHQVRHDNKKAEKTESVSKLFIAVFAIASLAGGWILYKNHIRLPLGIERDLTVLFFFACGWLSKDPIRNRLCVKGKKSIPWSLAVATSITAFILYATFEVPDPNFSIMNNILWKSLPIFIASSFFGIAGLVTAFVAADKIPNIGPIRTVKGILRNISRNALVILAVHWYILLVMRLLFRDAFNKPGIAYLSIAIVAAGVIAAIPLFRCKLYKLLGKQPASVRESLNIRD